MKYIVNILLFFIMIYSLTVMPIDMKALQVDVSWEKYKAIEEKKENQEQQAQIDETVKTSPYKFTYTGNTYLHNPNEIQFTLEGDEKISDLQADVTAHLTFEWENRLTGDKQILSVPETAIKAEIPAAQATQNNITVSLSSLTQIPDGQYKLRINSQSELTTGSEGVLLDVSWFKTSSYTPADTLKLGKSVAVTYYYPTQDKSSLIPITEPVSNEKVLRKIATHLFNGSSTMTGIQSGQLAPRIRNIQLKSGKLSLYMNTADVETATAKGLTPQLMSEVISKTYFSLPYVEEIYLYVDNKPVGPDWTVLTEASPILKPAVTTALYRLTNVGNALYYVPSTQSFTTASQLLDALSTADSSQKGKNSLMVIPANVTLSSTLNPENPKNLLVNLTLTGDLYGKDPALTQMFLDNIAINLVNSGLIETVSFTVNGSAVTDLNGINLEGEYQTPTYLNVKRAAS